MKIVTQHGTNRAGGQGWAHTRGAATSIGAANVREKARELLSASDGTHTTRADFLSNGARCLSRTVSDVTFARAVRAKKLGGVAGFWRIAICTGKYCGCTFICKVIFKVHARTIPTHSRVGRAPLESRAVKESRATLTTTSYICGCRAKLFWKTGS
jgi:hypothetical protein